MIANLMKAANKQETNKAADLLLAPAGKHPVAQASGLIAFLKRFVQPGTNAFAPLTVQRLRILATNEDTDIRALALAALRVGGGQQLEIRSWCDERLRALPTDDPVRSRWAVAAGYLGDALAAKGDQRNALACFDCSLEVKPDSVVTLSHRALSSLNMGDSESALQALRKAVTIQPYRAALHFQLASVYQQRQQISEAIRELEAGLEYAPDDPKANRMLDQLRRRGQ